MITTQKDTSGLVTNGLGQSYRLGIKASGFGHILSILRDQLYADKILAPIREYSTNALDAHAEKGIKDRPIVVKLPNSMNPTFAVRDFGYGMSEDKVRDVYANYGESTKRNSNEQVGMLGIGSKSAFAYTDSFTIVSFQNGYKTSYVCHVAGSDTGDIVKMGKEKTSEEDGIEVQVPVKSEDIKDFVTRAEKFFRHWDLLPKFEGNTINITQVKKSFFGKNWYITENSDQRPKVIMGNISYELNKYSLSFTKNGVDSTEESHLGHLLDFGLIMTVPIGSVDVAASREALQYTPKTITAVIAAAREAMKELTAIVEAKFNECKTNFEKKCVFASFSEYGSPFYSLNYLIRNKFSDIGAHYRMSELTSDIAQVTQYARSRRGARRVRGSVQNTYDYISCNTNYQYVLHDDQTIKNPLNRLAVLCERDVNFFNKKFSGVYLIRVINPAKFKAWATKNSFDIPLVDLSSLPLVKTSELYPSTSNSVPSARNILNGKKILMVNFDSLHSYNDSANFKHDVLPNDGQKIPYVVINRYRIVKEGHRDIQPYEFLTEFKSFCETFNLKLPVLAAVKVATEAKLDKSRFITFEKYLNKLVESNKKVSDSMTAHQAYVKVNNYYVSSIVIDVGNNISTKLLDGLSKSMDKLTSNSPLKKFLDVFNKWNVKPTSLKANKDTVLNFVQMHGGKNILPNFETEFKDFLKLGKTVCQTYPLFRFMDPYQVTQGAAISSLIDYINYVDDHVVGKKQ